MTRLLWAVCRLDKIDFSSIIDIRVTRVTLISMVQFGIVWTRPFPCLALALFKGRGVFSSKMALAAASGGFFSIGIPRIEIAQVRQRKPDYNPPLSRANKISRADSSFRVTDGNIAAIDFGTTSVSLAYTTKGYDKVNTFILNTEKGSRSVPHAVLLKKEGSKIAVAGFGNIAKSKFTSLRKGEHLEYIYFERIKILMRREKVI